MKMMGEASWWRPTAMPPLLIVALPEIKHQMMVVPSIAEEDQNL